MPEEKQENKPEKDLSLPALRTYKTDAAEYTRRENISRTDIALKEGGGRLTAKKLPRQIKKWKIILALLSLIIVGGAASFLLYSGLRIKREPEEKTISLPRPLIISEQEKVLTVSDKKGFVSLLQKEKQDRSLLLGLLRYLSVAKENPAGEKIFLETKEFLSLIEAKPPQILEETLTQRFYLGVMTGKSADKNFPLLVLEARFFEQSFAGMLKWEERMESDLGFLTENGLALEKESGFSDEVIKNQDVRIKKDKEGRTIILYAFFNRRFIIITPEKEALQKTIERMSQAPIF